MQWTYLQDAIDTLDQVLLGDFDGDGRCEVFAVNRYARTWETSTFPKPAVVRKPCPYVFRKIAMWPPVR